jgi:cytochrome P450
MDLRVLSSLAAGFIFLFAVVKSVIKIWWTPVRLKMSFESQGISGPPYRLLYGNTVEVVEMMKEANSVPMELSTHNILPRVLPEIHRWTMAYGKNFVYWFGPVPRLVIPQPELIKELLCHKFEQYEKPEPIPQIRQLCGDGLANSQGEKWARQRRFLSPAFHAEALKSMVPVVVASATYLLDKWNEAVDSGEKEIEVFNEFRNLTADVIARTAFGSSYMEGKHIFDLQTEQAILVVESFRNFFIPGYRFLPTRSNLKGRRLDREIQRSLREIISNREKNMRVEEVDENKDLLGLILMAAKKGTGEKHLSMSFQDMIDECKTFFVAGHETPSILLTWTVILLAMYTDWQDLAMEEVLRLCKYGSSRGADTLSPITVYGEDDLQNHEAGESQSSKRH